MVLNLSDRLNRSNAFSDKRASLGVTGAGLMTEQQFETEVMALLRTPFSGPDGGQRLNKLKAIFQAIDDPTLAVTLYERLFDG